MDRAVGWDDTHDGQVQGFEIVAPYTLRFVFTDATDQVID